MSGLYLGSLNLFGSMNKNFGTVCTLYCLVILHCYVQFLVCSIDILGEYITAKTLHQTFSLESIVFPLLV